MERIKQVILIRKDLNMRRGKEIAQGSHASMEFVVQQLRAQIQPGEEPQKVAIELDAQAVKWISEGIAKVCLKVNSEEELLGFHQKALDAGLKSALIRDSGRTEFHGEATYTACAIGPDEQNKIDAVTGTLSLY